VRGFEGRGHRRIFVDGRGRLIVRAVLIVGLSLNRISEIITENKPPEFVIGLSHFLIFYYSRPIVITFTSMPYCENISYYKTSTLTSFCLQYLNILCYPTWQCPVFLREQPGNPSSRRNVGRRNVCRRSVVDEMSVDELSWNPLQGPS